MNSKFRYTNNLPLAAYLLEKRFILADYYSENGTFFFGFEPHPDLDARTKEFRRGVATGNIQQFCQYLNQLKSIIFGR